jgi:glycosyltransferase involved in cell wall biosynthesis
MVSVIVCTYNRAKYLLETLTHLLKQGADASSFEVLLINNNSTDDTEEICNEFSANNPGFPFRYIVENSQGLSHARNRGIKEAKGDILTFIDDDAFAAPNFIEFIAEYFHKNESTAAIGGKIIPRYEESTPKWMSKYLLPLVAALDLGDEIIPFPNGKFPIGANMSIRKEVFDKYGVFDVNLGRKGDALEGSEEKDLFFRILKSGASINYLPDAVVHHIIPAKRVSQEYIRRQAIGIGKSERIRTKQLNQYPSFLLGEVMKWAGTVALSCMYLLKLQPAKASMLIRFRANVTRGIIND